MAEVRYRGTKVVTVSPDYADNTKFADEWLPAQAGTDAALAMAMGHVILKEFFVDRQVPFFTEYVKTYTDLPFLITLIDNAEHGGLVPGKFLTEADLRESSRRRLAQPAEAAWKTVLLDTGTGNRSFPTVPWGSATPTQGSVAGTSIWRASPLLSRSAMSTTTRSSRCCSFASRRPTDQDPCSAAVSRFSGSASRCHHGVRPHARPARSRPSRSAGRLAQRLRRPTAPYTPAWQAEITSVPAEACIRIAREFATNSEQSKGRSMIIMGAGICQWFHADATYRSILSLLILTGCMGRNGGGWAHYVGQEKCRPITGWLSLANALDWSRPPRTMIGTAYWYMHTDQWRSMGTPPTPSPPAGRGNLAGMHTADTARPIGAAGMDAVLSAVQPQPIGSRRPGAAAVAAGEAPMRPPTLRTRSPPARSRCRSRMSMRPRTGPGR